MKYITPVFFLLCFFYLMIMFALSFQGQKHNIPIKNKPILKPVVKTPEYPIAYVTIYHPTLKECGSDKNITASGRPGEIGTCAVSQIMFDYYVNMFDTIEVIEGNLKGKYVVIDKAGSKIKIIDIWRPVDDQVKGCYKTGFKVISGQ